MGVQGVWQQRRGGGRRGGGGGGVGGQHALQPLKVSNFLTATRRGRSCFAPMARTGSAPLLSDFLQEKERAAAAASVLSRVVLDRNVYLNLGLLLCGQERSYICIFQKMVVGRTSAFVGPKNMSHL